LKTERKKARNAKIIDAMGLEKQRPQQNTTKVRKAQPTWKESDPSQPIAKAATRSVSIQGRQIEGTKDTEDQKRELFISSKKPDESVSHTSTKHQEDHKKALYIASKKSKDQTSLSISQFNGARKMKGGGYQFSVKLKGKKKFEWVHLEDVPDGYSRFYFVKCFRVCSNNRYLTLSFARRGADGCCRAKIREWNCSES
jgi:hypothetical protein